MIPSKKLNPAWAVFALPFAVLWLLLLAVVGGIQMVLYIFRRKSIK